jgi:hypothetical protein
MAVITRDDWGAGPQKADTIPLPVTRLWLHHTVTPQWTGVEAARRLQKIALDRGFLDISYSWLVDVAGNEIEGRGWGRAGAHTVGFNNTSHAISLIGNFDVDRPPDAMLRGAANLVRKHARVGPDRITGGHRDAEGASTACPGRHAYAAIDTINQLAHAAPHTESDDMRLNDEGPHIKILQRHLDRLLTRDVTVDGVYGPATADAVGDAHERLGFSRVTDTAVAVWPKLQLVVSGVWDEWNRAAERVKVQNGRIQDLERTHREDQEFPHVPHIHPMEPEPAPAEPA